VQGLRDGRGMQQVRPRCLYFRSLSLLSAWPDLCNSASRRWSRPSACFLLQCTDESNFVGEYVRGKRHGVGIYSFPNGDKVRRTL
jgi:hypothetical protein